MVTGKQVGGLILGIILFIALIVAAFYVSPAPVETFTPDGTHLGDFQIGGNWYNILQLIFGPEVDKTWVTTSSFFQYLIFPFAAIWLVMYGIFEEIVFFRRITWFSPAMAFIVSIITSSSGILVRIMRGYLMMAGGLGILFFGFILIIGIFLWFLGRLATYGMGMGPLKMTVEMVRRRGAIDTTLVRAQRHATQIRSTDPARAAQIDTLVSQAEVKLAQSPPDLNGAERIVNQIVRLIH